MSDAEFDEEVIEPNTKLPDLMRKLEDGDFQNFCGAEIQTLLTTLRRTAKRTNKAANGRITIELAFSVGRDGYAQSVGKVTRKEPKAPVRPESTLYLDEDGDINGRPVAKQTSIFEVKAPKELRDVGVDKLTIAVPATKGL